MPEGLCFIYPARKGNGTASGLTIMKDSLEMGCMRKLDYLSETRRNWALFVRSLSLPVLESEQIG